MKDAITQILLDRPGVKAKVIARELGTNRKDVNSFLHQNPEAFVKDSGFGWHVVVPEKITVTLAGDAWVDGESLDVSLSKVNPLLGPSVVEVHFIFPSGCKVLLEAAARLLALAINPVAI